MSNTQSKTPAVPNDAIVVVENLPSSPQTGIMALIEKVAMLPSEQQTGVLERLWAMHKEQESSLSERDYNAAMVRLQEKLAGIKIHKSGKIEFEGKKRDGTAYKQETPYAKLEDIDKVLRPLMREEGFVVTYLTEGTDRVVVKCKITHKSGHCEVSSMQLPLDTSGSKNNLQGAGSSISYGRRYTLCAMLNIVILGEDDDGNGGTIDEAQAQNIHKLIKESDTITDRFLKKICHGVTKVEDIAFKDYRAAVSALNEKIAKNKKESTDVKQQA